ncbi:hypothetical protein Y1Q_0023415 [Alligator mississippiensis]|uniref:Uncharacterized protein n=1 Tax=Alligator mississippiensis TaxID=8496 RepID=A0A151NPL2_ALLMI|nr:hypothetical protein Y1Q_0023415 [Alligator mississippiensis]
MCILDKETTDEAILEMCSALQDMTDLVESDCFVLGVLDLQLGTVVFPLLLIREPTYPFFLWLMEPYNGKLEPHQAYFNWCLGWTHV